MAIIHLRKGDTLSVQANFTEAGVEYDMTGWTVTAQMSYANCTPVDCAVTWPDQAGGLALVSLTEDETSALHADDYLLQIRAVAPDGSSTSSPPATVRVRE